MREIKVFTDEQIAFIGACIYAQDKSSGHIDVAYNLFMDKMKPKEDKDEKGSL